MKIQQINTSINTTQHYKDNGKNNTKKCFANITNIIPNQISFQGKYYPFGYFTDKEILDTYKYIEYDDDEWKKRAEHDFICEYSFIKYVFRGGAEEVQERLRRIELLRKGLKKLELEEKKKKKELKKLEIVQAEKDLELAKNTFKNEYITLLELEKTNSDIKIPNAILIEEDRTKLIPKFIKQIKSENIIIKEAKYPDVKKIKSKLIKAKNKDEKTKTNYNDLANIEAQKHFLKKINNILIKSKKIYETNKERTLLYLPDFEIYVREKEENKRIIATFKALMCSCADKYKCTLLIKVAKDKLSKIDPILFVDSRVQTRIKI